jgi:predicted dithiol-disulfide oxidoreductase (DUF899 family)
MVRARRETRSHRHVRAVADPRTSGDNALMTTPTIDHPNVVSPAEWVAARRALLIKEKDLTRQRDALDRQRRELPWVTVDKEYLFDCPRGRVTLSDLFGGRSQLIVQHFMFGPGWKEGCVGCSFKADHVDAAAIHLEHHDVTFVAISRAPLHEIEAFRKRMGWRFRWVSSYGSDFNYDYHVSFPKDGVATGKVYYNYATRDFLSEELSGNSVFYKNAAGTVYHTYSTHARGDEMLVGAYMYLDLTPKGRAETGPRHNLTDWVRHHDRYDDESCVDRGRNVAARPAQAPRACETGPP